MNKLIVYVFLVTVDVENVWFIRAGMIAELVNDVMEKDILIIIQFIKRLFFVFIIKELRFQTIETGNMTIN